VVKRIQRQSRKGKNFYERVFVEYGDESIAELVTAQVGIQNVSNIVSKIIEDNRIGLSYIEKSSRYVPYDEKVNGRFLYIEGEK
jgi:Predicted alternative thymidylate synthase